MRTRTFTVPADAVAVEGRRYEVAAPGTSAVTDAAEPTWYSTCACVCSLPSGWFGTHDTASAVPVAATAGSPESDGASGGVMVVTELDSAHAEARSPRTALTR